MGWTPNDGMKKGGVPAEEPVPRRRRPRASTASTEPSESTKTRRRVKAFAADAATMPDRDERVNDERPAGGNRDHDIDTRKRSNVKLGKRWSQIVTEIKRGDYTWQQFTEGLTAEELARGQLKDVNGGFHGRPPTLVPREFHLSCFRELKRRFDEEFQSGVLDIAKEYVKLAQDTALPVKDRARMMQYAMERVFGGIPKEVLVKQDSPWESVFAAVIVNDAGEVPERELHRYDQYNEDEDEGSDD